MLEIETVAALRADLKQLRARQRIALVPTMGNLHAGHLALVREAQRLADLVIAYIFVNRLQFGPSEDFDRYPRTMDADRAKLAGLGVPILFAPSEPEIYPRPQTFAVDPPPLANELCGAFRPGHFRGMATVVLKMFNIVSPDVATFGKKDYQQVNIVRDMTGQFGLPIEIAAIETVREADGLAMSSRNSYLSPEHRREAPRLYAELSALANASAVDSSVSLEATAAEVQHRLSAAGWRMDYVEVRRRADLVRPAAGDRELVVLAAGWLGQTRLIDNVEFTRN